MKSMQDNCGVFGIYSKQDCVYDIYRGIDFLQHRGQEYCGISTFDQVVDREKQIDFFRNRDDDEVWDTTPGDQINHVTHHGKVINTFTDEELRSLTGRWGIGHVSLWERQPMKWHSRLGEIAVAFSGNVMNSAELMQEMMDRGKSFYKSYAIETISKIIIEEPDIVSGIAALASKVKGAYSLVVLTKDGVYAARDIYGFRPLVLGNDGERFAVGSESRAMQNLGMSIYRDVRPGEIVLINDQGFKTVKQLHSPRKAHCAFEWAYTASIDSLLDGVFVQEARNNMGARLAQRDIDEGGIEAEIVSPVPLSGIGHALGYHRQSKIDYQEVYLYHRYADRSYTQATQVAREKMAKRKLSILPYAIKGRRIVLCDDSIVRGTQIMYKVKELKDAGAREVHVRVACPPLMYPCDFGVSTRSYEELLAREFFGTNDIMSMKDLRDLETWIARKVDADSVKFNTMDDFVAALRIPRGELCLKCFDGHVPWKE